MAGKTQTAIVLDKGLGLSHCTLTSKGRIYNVPFEKFAIMPEDLEIGQRVVLETKAGKLFTTQALEPVEKRINNLTEESLYVYTQPQFDQVNQNAILRRLLKASISILKDEVVTKKSESLNKENLVRILTGECNNVARRPIQEINARMIHSATCTSPFVKCVHTQGLQKQRTIGRQA